MAGFNPYLSGAYTGQPLTPWGYPATTAPPAYSQTFSGTGSHLYGQPAQQQKGMSNLLRVTGPESAKAYPIGIDASVVLFDADNPIFYLLSSDDSGFKTMRTFRFEEETPIDVKATVDEAETVAYASKDDLDILEKSIGKKLDVLEKMLEGLVS